MKLKRSEDVYELLSIYHGGVLTPFNATDKVRPGFAGTRKYLDVVRGLRCCRMEGSDNVHLSMQGRTKLYVNPIDIL